MRKTCLIADSFCTRHLTGQGHPESPLRYLAIDSLLTQKGFKNPDNTFKPRKANKTDLLLCHSENYLNIVEDNIQNCSQLNAIDGTYSLSTGDVQICPSSLEAALLAAGGALTAVDLVMEGNADNVFSYLRPPGHHACHDKGMGFCLFNNVAIAGRYAQQVYGIKQVLIVDWDVHHGNGTQEIFELDPSIFYFSTHQKGLYPGTGSENESGSGKAKGTKLNCPILPGSESRLHVLAAFKGPLMEAMKNFKPELILISAGFDAHYLDPLGGFNLTEDDFAELTKIVMRIADCYCGGRIVSLLEGGYHLQGLASSALAHVLTLGV
jgi:acetoin utilization deacetylase AcuC-like enzyme